MPAMEKVLFHCNNKGFDDKYYRDMILDYLNTFERATKEDFRKLLGDKLPDVLSIRQKNRKISTLMEYLKRNQKIEYRDGFWTPKK